MMINTRIGRLGARVALGAAIAVAPAAAVTGVASAAPAVASTPTVHAADGWYYWHCVQQHEYWRPACHGPAVPPPPPPPTGSFGGFLEIG